MKKPERKKFETKLLQLVEELTRNPQELLRDSKEVDDGIQDYIDFATRSYTKEFLLSLSNLERKKLRQVEAALKRVRTPDYGLCASCEEEISRKRLLAAPWVEFCIRCQEEEERESARAAGTFNILGEEADHSPDE